MKQVQIDGSCILYKKKSGFGSKPNLQISKMLFLQIQPRIPSGTESRIDFWLFRFSAPRTVLKKHLFMGTQHQVPGSDLKYASTKLRFHSLMNAGVKAGIMKS